jgi:hypothetical protein
VKEEIRQETYQVKRVGQVDDSLKYGRRKKTASLFRKPNMSQQDQ